MQKLSPDVTLQEVIDIQGKKLLWNQYSLFPSSSSEIKNLIEAIESNKKIEMVYAKGNKKNQVRTLQPLGIIRNPDGDYLQAFDATEDRAKRFMLEFVKDVVVVYESLFERRFANLVCIFKFENLKYSKLLKKLRF